MCISLYRMSNMRIMCTLVELSHLSIKRKVNCSMSKLRLKADNIGTNAMDLCKCFVGRAFVTLFRRYFFRWFIRFVHWYVLFGWFRKRIHFSLFAVLFFPILYLCVCVHLVFLLRFFCVFCFVSFIFFYTFDSSSNSLPFLLQIFLFYFSSNFHQTYEYGWRFAMDKSVLLAHSLVVCTSIRAVSDDLC